MLVTHTTLTNKYTLIITCYVILGTIVIVN
jgi:hypothetical protein